MKAIGKYDLYGTLGEGAFGETRYAVNREINEAAAIKILGKDKIQTRNMGAQIKKEISIMKMINHHHVVSVKDVFATATKIFIVLEFVGGGELFDKIANEGKLPEEKARFYFKQLVEGLSHCHNNGVCHRDLKPENLLLDTDGNLKISNFGFSTLNIGDADGDGGARTELLHTTCGTPNYVAPEVLGKDGYDGKRADVWSIGVILYVLLAGYLPFDENTMVQLFQKIKNADFEYPDWFSDEAEDLLSKILVPDPAQRIKMTDIKNHPWMVHADSGPEPSHANNSAATAGAPPMSNTGGSSVVPTPPAKKNAAAGKSAPAAAPQSKAVTPPTPPTSATAAPAAPAADTREFTDSTAITTSAPVAAASPAIIVPPISPITTQPAPAGQQVPVTSANLRSFLLREQATIREIAHEVDSTAVAITWCAAGCSGASLVAAMIHCCPAWVVGVTAFCSGAGSLASPQACCQDSACCGMLKKRSASTDSNVTAATNQQDEPASPGEGTELITQYI